MQLNFCKDLLANEEFKEKLFISPPFGKYIKTPVSTSIRGTLSWSVRNGWFVQVLRTVRPVKGGWVNKIGLRNPGIQNIDLGSDDVYSVVGMDEKEWDNILEYLPRNTKIEINIGCPNSWGMCFTNAHLKKYVEKFPYIIIKLSPKILLEDIKFYYDNGIKKLHLSNTLPCDRGGISGLQQKIINLPLIEKTKLLLPDAFIIAGGGIYTLQDAIDYSNVGADGYSLSTVWFNPFKATKLVKQIKEEILEKNIIGAKYGLQLRAIS